MKKAEQVEFVIDGGPLMRTAITVMIEAVGLSCQTYSSGSQSIDLWRR
jgi:FixJ family two-component response regulator